MKDVAINKCHSSLMRYYPSTSAVSEKVLIRNTAQQLLEKWREKLRETIDKEDCWGTLD